MSRRRLKRWLPSTAKMKTQRSLKIFGGLLNSPNLWHMNRSSIAKAVAIGLVWAWVPIPFQMIFAAAFAIFFRANLALSVALVWLTNPVTMPIVYYFAYRVGLAILGGPAGHFSFELSWEWLVTGMLSIWKPFLLGCFVCGTTSAVFGYFATHALWRLSVNQQWKERTKRRLARNQNK